MSGATTSANSWPIERNTYKFSTSFRKIIIAWKQDLILATEVAALTGRKHWATVNRLISTRLDKDVYATVTSFFPEDEEEIEALDPKILLQQIEEILVTTDQVE